MSDKVIPDIDELIGTITHSSLPTVIIEGVDDVIVYRKLEDIFFDLGLSVLPVFGRNNVIKIFDRLHEFAHADKFAFIADNDVWGVLGTPAKYLSKHIIFTDGYSIENDIFKDNEIIKYMEGDELATFQQEVKRFSYWYALVVRRTNDKQQGAKIKTYVGDILDSRDEYERQVALIEGEQYPHELLDLINSDFAKYLRGKSLMQLVSRQLERKNRDIKVKPNFFFAQSRAKPGPLLSRIYNDVGNFFGQAPVTICDDMRPAAGLSHA
jgi:hypothetical protein